MSAFPARRLPAAALGLSLALLLTACGGGDEDPQAGTAAPAGALVAGCNTSAYVAGAVAEPTLADLAAYTGSFHGDEGQYDAQFNFVKTGTATVVIGADGSVSYGGKAYPVTSVCQDKVAGPYGRLVYFLVGNGHLDVADRAQAGLGQAWGVSPADGTTVFTLGVR